MALVGCLGGYIDTSNSSGFKPFMFFAALAHGVLRGNSATDREQAQATTTTTYELSSTIPTLPFVGNWTTLVGPANPDGTGIMAPVLQQQSDCSLTETLIPYVNNNGDVTEAVALAGAQTYLHTLSGLSTTPNVFPQGCAETALGRRSTFTAMQLSSTSTSVSFIGIDTISEQLEILAVSRTTGAATTTALTTGRSRSFMVVDMNGDGQGDIVANGVGYGAGTSGSVVVFLNNGNGTFRTATTVANGGSNFVVDDLNGDGKPDLVMDNGYDTNGLVIPGAMTMLGNGDGTLQAGVVSATGITQPSGALITGDFNGDGKKDLVLGSQVALGAGDGSFSALVPSSTTAGIGLSFNATVGDFNKDGKLDLAFTSFGSLQLLVGAGDGTFSKGLRYASIDPSQSLAATDVDGDGNLDIVVGGVSPGTYAPGTNDLAKARIQVLLGRGDGSFVGAPAYPGQILQNLSSPQMATGDFDGDGKFDMLMVDSATGSALSVLPGDGRGGLGTAVLSTLAIRPSIMSAVDMNGDGKLDAVLAGQTTAGTAVLSVVANQGGNRFAAEQDYALPNFAASMATGDFDGDGHVDVAVGLSTMTTGAGPTGVYVLYGQAGGGLAAPVLIDASINPVALAASDIDADGRAELAIADFGTNTVAGAVHVYRGSASRAFTAAVVPTITATRFSSIAFGDVNKDGKPDLLAAGTVPGASFGSGTPNVYTYLNDGSGGLGAPLVHPQFGNAANALALADFNHDGSIDVAVGNQGDFTEIFLGVGDGTYLDGALAMGQSANALAVADLDNDLFPELFAGIPGVGVVVFKNIGTAAAWAGPPAVTGSGAGSGTTTTTTTTATAGDFTLALAPTSGSVTAGQSAQTVVSVTPSDTSSQSVALSCTSGLPAGAICVFSAPSVALSAGTAGSSSLTIRTAAQAVGSGGAGIDWSGPQSPAQWLVLAALVMSAGMATRRNKAARRVAGVVLMTSLLASCWTDDGGNGSAAGAVDSSAAGTTYSVVVTATGGSTSHTATYALTVH